MCGIAGYVGSGDSLRQAVASLKRLEYRGYDSAGVAYSVGDRLTIARCPGKVADLEALIGALPAAAGPAIAHTRWATHGRPSEANAHPHADCTGRLAVVHNGIIENHQAIRHELLAAGHCIQSETDTEVISHLIEDELAERRGRSGLVDAVRAATARLQGSFAVAVLWSGAPDVIVAARHDSPLIVGLGDGGAFVASDIPALVGWADRLSALQDGDVALIRGRSVTIWDSDGMKREPSMVPLTVSREAAEKRGFAHFMLKEIHEQPHAVRETCRGRIGLNGQVALDGVGDSVVEILQTGNVHFVACGTAYHAGLIGKRLWDQELRRHADCSVSSEFRYDRPIVDERTLAVFVSQSGETADTVAAARYARRLGAKTLAVVNCMGTSLERETEAVLITRAGPEIGVASTKAYSAQVAAMGLLAGQAGWDDAGRALSALPEAIGKVLDSEDTIKAVASDLAASNCFFFLGRGHDAAVAAEAALKLKEISYIHAEAYPAGEMKHGPLALVEPGVAVVGLCTRAATHDKMASNLMEVRARDGRVVAVVSEGLPIPEAATDAIVVPSVSEYVSPIVTMVAMQLLAYYVALARGCSIDQPRNLAKSVTVE